MTTQTCDTLIDEGINYGIKPYPLSALGDDWSMTTHAGKRSSRFAFVGTMCHRRYHATWSIIDKRLNLIGFSAKPSDEDGGARRDMMLEIFGTGSLFAFWFTGSVHAGFGELLEGMFETDHEFEHVWTFEHGKLVDKRVRHNTSAPVRKKNSVSPQLRKFLDEL